jgi:hypothetical protein
MIPVLSAPAQVRGGDPEVGMPELALDDQERDPRRRTPSGLSPGTRITATISSTVGGSGG